jgi:xanthine dehydrogenase YagT iron-sulfur-binding subunit
MFAVVAIAQACVTGTPVMSKVSFAVNGEARKLELDTRTTLLDTRTTLLDALREHLHLTGTEKLGQLRGRNSWHSI